MKLAPNSVVEQVKLCQAALKQELMTDAVSCCLCEGHEATCVGDDSAAW